MGLDRFELSTPRLSSVCSNQLSYRPSNPLSNPPPSSPGQAALHHAQVVSKTRQGPTPLGPSKPESMPTRKVAKNFASDLPPAFDLVNLEEAIAGSPKLLRKEVIQPQVPLRLPCYDFTPVTSHSLSACVLAVRSAISGATDSHGVTGGVYKARERIHRSVLICDY